MVFPRDHWPVCAGMVVRLLATPPLPWLVGSEGGALVGVAVDTPLVAGTAGETCELLREWLGREDCRRDSRVESVRFGGGAAYDRSWEELRRDEGGRATFVVS